MSAEEGRYYGLRLLRWTVATGLGSCTFHTVEIGAVAILVLPVVVY
jgi:hypothetical protein